MAKRESLKKLSTESTYVWKQKDLIQELLLCQTPTSVLTPIIQQVSAEGSLTLPFQDSLPPFHAVTYDYFGQSYIPTLTFSFIIERPTSQGIAVKNFKG